MPAGGGFAPPLPHSPVPPAAAPGPARPRHAVKVAVLVGIVSAVAAALITSGVFLAAGGGRNLEERAVSATTSTPPGTANRVVGPALDIQALLAKAQPSVVAIHVKATTSRGTLGGAGTGVIISDDGVVLTNAHVIQSADLNQMTVTLADGTEKQTELVGSLVDNDVALIKIRGATGLTKAELGSSEAAQVGDDVVAIGNALNLGEKPTVTKGIISAKDRIIEDDIGTRRGHLIQTDAAINPGNSGGPLLNAQGQVIGINTAVIGTTGDQSVQNIGFAIAIDDINPLIDQIKAGQGQVTPDQAFLGVQSISLSEATEAEKEGFEITASEGAVVEGVAAGSAAADAGLRQGDVITAIDGTPVTTKSDVGDIIRSKQPGDDITIDFERQGTPGQATTTLRSRQESGGG
ncbi:MAG: trypsin-like peptidase domain-containing protein [Actinobacteria bacterium]|nr:trypsin-like peptidase domain-containing protein [Actinomycetota bacterium]